MKHVGVGTVEIASNSQVHLNLTSLLCDHIDFKEAEVTLKVVKNRLEHTLDWT